VLNQFKTAKPGQDGANTVGMQFALA